MVRSRRGRRQPIGITPPAPDTGDPDEDVEDGPLRRCIVTSTRRPRETMLRFVVAPDGSLTFDAAARLPGRGIWLTASAPILARAIARHGFDRAARGTVIVPADLPERIEAGLVARCCDTIGLARRAGLAVAGYEKVCAGLRREAPGAVVIASDAADWARRKLAAAAGSRDLIDCLSSSELGGVFGREKIVHVLLGPGPLATRLATEARRLASFRCSDVAPVANRQDAV